MASKLTRLNSSEEFTEAELKQIYEEHVAAENEGDISREELLRNGLTKLEKPALQ